MSTPAKRARARRDPALTPPRPIAPGSGPVRSVTLRVGRRSVQLGGNLVAGSPWEFTREGAATVQLSVADETGRLMAVISDEALLLAGEVRVTLGGVTYVLLSVESSDGRTYALTFEDWAAWRFRQFSRFMAADRATLTRAGFVARMADEARVPAYIPEVGDVQPVRGRR